MSANDNPSTNAAKSLICGILSVIANAVAITFGVYFKAMSELAGGILMLLALIVAIYGCLSGWRALSSGKSGELGMAIPGIVLSGISVLVYAIGMLGNLPK